MKRLLLLVLFIPVFAGGQIITTVAGNGGGSYNGDGGPATLASIGANGGICFDIFGNYYFGENNNTVRKVSPVGIISTVAGNGISGFSGDGGPATLAQLNFSGCFAVDRFGNLYISDGSNNRIRKVDVTSGIISTFAGNGVAGYSGDGGNATDASLSFPYGICFDNIGNLYIADQQKL